MVCLVSLLLIGLFSTKQAQWKIFPHAWEVLWPTTAACFQEMSIHTHICVKLLFQAQTMFSVASNWAHMHCALYHYMLGSIRWLVPTDAIGRRTNWCTTDKAGRQAPLALWFYSWILELNREVPDFWHSKDINKSGESDLFFFFQGCRGYFSQCTQEFMNDKTTLKKTPLTHTVSLSLSVLAERSDKNKIDVSLSLQCGNDRK